MQTSLGWAFFDPPVTRIKIRNPDTGETRYIGPNDDIPDGFIPVYGADVTEPGGGAPAAPAAASKFPWLLWLILFFVIAAAFTKE